MEGINPILKGSVERYLKKASIRILRMFVRSSGSEKRKKKQNWMSGTRLVLY